MSVGNSFRPHPWRRGAWWEYLPLLGGIPVHQELPRPLLEARSLEKHLGEARTHWILRESAPCLALSPVSCVHLPYPLRFSTSRQTLTWIPDSFFSR